MAVVFLLLVLNLAISFWNASVVGRYWTERHELPGYVRFMMWCGMIMAVSGFFYVYVAILTMVAHDFHIFEALAFALFQVEMSAAEATELAQNIFDLAYLVVIFPVLGTGLAIWSNSVIIAWKRRDLASIGIGVYNTGAQIHNMVNAFRHVPRATRSLSSGVKFRLKSKDSKALAYLVLLLLPVIISLGGAIATTAVIMKASDARYDLASVTTA